MMMINADKYTKVKSDFELVVKYDKICGETIGLLVAFLFTSSYIRGLYIIYDTIQHDRMRKI